MIKIKAKARLSLKKVAKPDLVRVKLKALLARESFYFFSILLLIGIIFEFFLPGLFLLYFNLAILTALWLLSLLFLLYV